MTAVRYRKLTEDDAELLAAGIRRVYGNTYPIPEFYDPDWIRDTINAGRLHTIVALDGKGDVVGCMSTVLETPGDLTADGSALMVAPEYREQGIVAQFGNHSLETYQALGLGGLHLYALALHDRVQKQTERAGAAVTGCLPAWFSREARVAGYDYPDARIGAVTLYMPLGNLPARVSHLPGRYADVLRNIYADLGLQRTILEASGQLSPPAETVYHEEHRPANRQLRVVVTRCGEDFEQLLSRFRDHCLRKDYEVCYIDLPLGDPAVGVATQRARAAGLIFGALMVERRGGDSVRLQGYREDSAAPGHMVLGTDRACELQRVVLEDQAELGSDFIR